MLLQRGLFSLFIQTIPAKTPKLKLKDSNYMSLTKKEKTTIIVSHLISLYSEKLQENQTMNQSVIDFVLKNTPQDYKEYLTMDLIDDVMSFISTHHMELS